MPRIDDEKVKQGLFRKKPHRSWDKDLSVSLKLPNEELNEPITTETQPPKYNSEGSFPLSQKNTEIKTIKSQQDSKLRFKEVQEGSKLELKEVQEDSKLELKEVQEDSKLGFNLKSNSTFNLSAESIAYRDLGIAYKAKNPNSIENKIKDLSGNEKKIFFFVIGICIKRESLSTGEFYTSDLEEVLKISKNSRKTAEKRLVTKGLLFRGESSRGKNATVCLKISDDVKQKATEAIARTVAEAPVNFSIDRAQEGANKGFKNYYSSSSNINTTTELPEDWLSLDFEQHEELTQVGFTSSQLKQLYQTGKLTADIVQNSLDYLAFDIKHNAVLDKYPNLLNVFMGAMRKGNPWAKPKNYKTQQELNLERLLAEKEEERARIKAVEEKLFHFAYEEWIEKTPQAELIKLLRSPHEWDLPELRDQHLKPHFAKTIWPTMRDDYVST